MGSSAPVSASPRKSWTACAVRELALTAASSEVSSAISDSRWSSLASSSLTATSTSAVERGLICGGGGFICDGLAGPAPTESPPGPYGSAADARLLLGANLSNGTTLAEPKRDVNQPGARPPPVRTACVGISILTATCALTQNGSESLRPGVSTTITSSAAATWSSAEPIPPSAVTTEPPVAAISFWMSAAASTPSGAHTISDSPGAAPVDLLFNSAFRRCFGVLTALSLSEAAMKDASSVAATFVPPRAALLATDLANLPSALSSG
mmetsp:Transcript_33240/g.87063  ORF Transcript_33240/g.87063 Transcript_33240/m.87063 type:complete len:267 (+) Transcript_33240:543-1343(+)